jgi:hypothetical protein
MHFNLFLEQFALEFVRYLAYSIQYIYLSVNKKNKQKINKSKTMTSINPNEVIVRF